MRALFACGLLAHVAILARWPDGSAGRRLRTPWRASRLDTSSGLRGESPFWAATQYDTAREHGPSDRSRRSRVPLASRVPLLAPVAAAPSGSAATKRVPWGCGRRSRKPLQGTLERLSCFWAAGRRSAVSVTEETTDAVVGRMAALAPWPTSSRCAPTSCATSTWPPCCAPARSRSSSPAARSRRAGASRTATRRARRRLLPRGGRPAASTSSTSRPASGFDDVVAAKAGRGLVLSWHDFEGTPDDLDAVYAADGRRSGRTSSRSR